LPATKLDFLTGLNVKQLTPLKKFLAKVK